MLILVCRMSCRLHHGIIAAGVEGMTAKDALEPHKEASGRSEASDRLVGVFGTRRNESAAGAHKGGYEDLV